MLTSRKRSETSQTKMDLALSDDDDDEQVDKALDMEVEPAGAVNAL